MNNNWVNDVVDNANRTVSSWPEWMQRPEVRTPVPPSSSAPVEMGHDGDPMSHVCVRLKRDNGKFVLWVSGGQRLRVETDSENSIRIVPVDMMGERRGGSDE
jgi:hypothetical protein